MSPLSDFRKMDAHELECASAAYAILIERAEHKFGHHSAEARELRREFRDLLAAQRNDAQ